MRKIILIILTFLNITSSVFALDVETHKAINSFIAQNTLHGFSLDSYLKNQLGMQKGDEEQFNSLEAWKWVRDGGKYEDVPYSFAPYVRSVNHFHNPLNDQGYNGFWGTGIMSGMSSTQWALLPPNTQSTLCLLGCYSWYDVRDYFYQALTSTNKTTRENYFAQTFRGVGQLMHLIEDASVPSHTRNDGHLFYNYEDYAVSYINQYGVPTPTSAGFFSGTINNIASFIDTNQYNETNPDPTVTAGTAIGLAEYANANFFSEDTINDSSLPYPRLEDTTITGKSYTGPLGTYTRQYYKKNCCGETNAGTGYLLAAVDYLDYWRQQYPSLSSGLPKLPVLDDNVYKDYASLLIPRAVGYSAGLLNYFFRGTLEITPPEQVAYAVTDGSITPYVDTDGNYHQQFRSIKAKIRNSTPDTIPGEEIQDGIIQAVAKYKIIPNYMYDLSNYPPDGNVMKDMGYSYSVSLPVTITSLSSSDPIEFTFNFTDNPIPAGITDLYLQVIFKGTLGNEADIAVAVGMKDLMEPTHQVFWNATDMFQLDGHLYTSDEIKNSPALAAQVDNDHDGVFNEPGEQYIDPHPVTFGIGYPSQPPGPVNPFTYSAITTVQSGEHIRVIALLDKPQNNYVALEKNDNIEAEPQYFFFSSAGVMNQDENGVWQTPTPITTFRYGLDIDGITQIPIRQHFKKAYFRCYPMEGSDPDGNPVCYYSESEVIPGELMPSQIDTIYFP